MVRKSVTCMVITVLLVAVLVWCTSMAQSVYASEVSVELSADRNTVAAGETLMLTVSVTGAQLSDVPVLPELEGFETVSVKQGTSIVITNGKMVSSVEFGYVLRALKEGVYEIGPLLLKIGGNEYQTNVVTVEVSSSRNLQAASSGSQGMHAVVDSENDLFLVVEPAKKDVYLGEVVPVKIKLYVGNVRINQIYYPSLSANGFYTGGFNEPLQYEVVVNSQIYNVVEFDTYVVPASQGVLKLGPAQIEVDVLVRDQSRMFFEDPFFDEFFSTYRVSSVNVASEEVNINVAALPSEGKPDNFKGAVGEFSLQVEATPESVTVGDPIVLTMKVSGKGSFKTVSAPVLSLTDGFKVYDPQVKESDSIEGVKIFEQVIIPTTSEVFELPEVLFSYFDPMEGEYKTLVAPSIPIHVITGGANGKAKLDEGTGIAGIASDLEIVFGTDIFYIKGSPGIIRTQDSYLYTQPWFWMLNAIPVMGLVGVGLYDRRKTRLENDMAYARFYRAGKVVSKEICIARAAMEKEDVAGFCDAVHKTIQQYLGDKFNLAVKGITRDVVEVLRNREVPDEILRQLTAFFQECDMLRYSPLSADKSRMGKLLDSLEQLVDKIEGLKNRGVKT
jgi:hypothetical protein